MKQIFEIVPPPSSGFAVAIGVIVALTAGLAILFLWIGWSARHVRFVISGDVLTIQAPFYGRSIPFRELNLHQAAIVDLKNDTVHQLSWRTNGIGLPGYAAGWFRMKGGAKALAFVTARDRIVMIPTSHDYTLLLSVRDPAAFLRALQNHAT